MRLVLRLALLAVVLLVVSFTVGQRSIPDAAGTIVPDSNSVAFWCGSESAGVKFDPVSTPFVVPPLPAGISSWALLVLKAGAEESANPVNQTFSDPIVGQSYSRTDGKDISHAILCYGPPVTTTTHATTTTHPTTTIATTTTCDDCVPDTQVITTLATTTTPSTTIASTTIATTSSTSSSTSSSTTTCPDCGTNPLTVPTTPGTTIATTVPVRSIPDETPPPTTRPTTTTTQLGTTTTVNRGAAPTDEFVPPATVVTPTTTPTELPRTGADPTLLAVGLSVCAVGGLLVGASRLPRKR